MSNDVFLITSGAYANDEITSDFGLLPTSFLPVGHKRLLELQIKLIENFVGKKFISLPDNYKLLHRDRDFIFENDIKIHWTNSNLSLSQSILSFINALDLNGHSRLFILHGDTLFENIKFESDLLSFGTTDMFYKWGDLIDFQSNSSEANFNKKVLSGYFSFSNIPLLKNELNKSNSFELALKGYHNKIPFNLVEGEGWLDFGHSNLYYRSKRKLNVTRSFNKAVVENNHIRKESIAVEKIKREYRWFKEAPESISNYLPQVWGFNQEQEKASYVIEFIGAPTLQEKFVFGNLPDYVYFKIVDHVFDFINKCKSFISPIKDKINVFDNLKNLYIEKTKSRIKDFIDQSGFNSKQNIIINGVKYPALNDFVLEVINVLERSISDNQNSNKLTLMHGDLCFSNILFDSRSNNIKIIDPRGSLTKNLDDSNIIYGDYRYDLAKLGHSLVGNYDFIVSGFYDLKFDSSLSNFEFIIQSSKREELVAYFFSKANSIGVTKEFLKASITNLFLSMLPLHNEDTDRQLALMLNAYKIYYN